MEMKLILVVSFNISVSTTIKQAHYIILNYKTINNLSFF